MDMKYKVLKIKPETYELLIRTKALMEFSESRKISFDECLRRLIESLPKVTVSMQPIEEKNEK